MLYALTSLAVIVATTVGGPEPTEKTPLLSGPSVSETNVTGESSTFSESTENPNQRMTGANPVIFREAVLALREAPEELRPTPEQTTQIAALLRKHQQTERAFMAKYGRELRRLNAGQRGTDRPVTDRAPDAQPGAGPQPAQRGPEGRLDMRVRPARGDQPKRADEPMTDRPAPDRPVAARPGPDRPTAQDPMIDRPMTDAPTAAPSAESPARQRLQEILALRPKIEDLERPVRALLTEPQLAWLDDQITTLAQERFEQQAMERYRRQAANDIAAQNQRLEQAIENLPPRLKAYIESLPEDERIPALQEMRQRRDNGTDRRRGGDGPAPTEKAPPTIDEIDIPDPSKGG